MSPKVRPPERLSLSAVALRARLHGRLGQGRVLSELAGAWLIVRYRLGLGALDRRVYALLVACRRISTGWLRRWLRAELEPWLRSDRAEVLRAGRIADAHRRRDVAKTALTTSLLIKEPGPDGEKGVLYSSVEDNWARLLVHHDARRFLNEYLLVGASSWSPTDYTVLAGFAGLSDDPIFVGISNQGDISDYSVLHPVVAPVPVMASDWINPEFYAPKPHPRREIDIVMVANFARFKRHWVLFQALRRMRRDARVALIGIRGPGRGETELREEAKAFGVSQELEILTNASIDVVTAYQCNARTSVILSAREGSCVAVTESFFADTPVAMMRTAHIGSRAYINECTGVLLDDGDLARQLSAFIERSGSFRPRRWALDHVTCFHSTKRLNALLRDHCVRAGRPWTRDITPMCWRYVPSYVNESDEREMKPALDRLRETHGIELERFVYQPRA
jgi:glycosyltransferase involved in cell wall biosynthesis